MTTAKQLGIAAAVASVALVEYLFWWHLVYPALGALVPYLKG